MFPPRSNWHFHYNGSRAIFTVRSVISNCSSLFTILLWDSTCFISGFSFMDGAIYRHCVLISPVLVLMSILPSGHIVMLSILHISTLASDRMLIRVFSLIHFDGQPAGPCFRYFLHTQLVSFPCSRCVKVFPQTPQVMRPVKGLAVVCLKPYIDVRFSASVVTRFHVSSSITPSSLYT